MSAAKAIATTQAVENLPIMPAASESAAVTESFPTFDAALRRAHMVKIHDTWGCPRVERQNLVNDHDDMGNTYAAKSWEADARWEVIEGCPDPVETAPDVTLVAAE